MHFAYSAAVLSLAVLTAAMTTVTVTEPCSSTTTQYATSTSDYAAACYTSPIPSFPASASNGNRTIPWGQPEFVQTNGTLCCSTLDQVRDGIDAVDAQIIALLAQRAGYVREATRFKATLDSVDVPSRDQQVIDEAVQGGDATAPKVPEVISKAVFEGIISGGVEFEKCVWESYGARQ